MPRLARRSSAVAALVVMMKAPFHYQWPACAPPSTCRVSPVTNAADSRYSTASTTSRTSPIRPSGCSPARKACVSGGCIGVLMTPGATALTRMPLSAYSIASDLVTASSPPLVRDASTDGTPFTGWPTSVVVTFTMCPPPCASICRTARCETWKNPARFTDSRLAKSASLYSVNGLAMKIPALLTSVSTRPNFSTAPPDHTVGGRRVADVPGDGEHVRRGVGLDGPGVGDDAVAAVEE